MGLDMYLNRYPRYKDTTPQMVNAIQSYLDWKDKCKDTESKASQYTLKEWCGVDEKDVPPSDYIDFYSRFYNRKYCDWDIDQKYGWNRITEEVGYWRKANHIHNWFVENIQGGADNCDSYIVDKEDLEKLLALCKKVKDIAILEKTMIVSGSHIENGKWVDDYIEGRTVVNADAIAALLPTRSGFFFGCTDYDEWYMRDIDNTIDILTNVLDETDFENEVIFYDSSW